MIINHLFKFIFKKNQLEPKSHKKIKVTNIPFKGILKNNLSLSFHT
jgi:hypothetical protein